MMGKNYFRGLLFFAVLLLPITRAVAGPPFLTDDPVPTDYRHFQIYLFSFTSTQPTLTFIQTPALEVDYGLLPNLEVNATLSYVSNSFHHQQEIIGSSSGFGDVQLGAVYRFIQETKYIPQVGFAPFYTIPTGSEERGLGNGQATLTLPLWAQKSWGSWTVDGGGGYVKNEAAGMRNYFFGGLLLQKDLSDKLTLGGELFSQGASSAITPFNTILNIGGSYNITKNFAVLLTVGHSIMGERELVTYAGLAWVC